MTQQYETKDNSIALYLNGIAHIATSVQLKVENGIAQIVGIAPKFMPESLHTILDSKDIKIKNARVLEPTTLAEIAEGKIRIPEVVYDKGDKCDVTPLLVQGDKLLVEVVLGVGELVVYSKPLDAFGYKGVDKQNIRKRQAFELQLDGLENGIDKTLKLSYLTEGITLIPHYNVVLVGNKLVLNAEVEVENKTGKSYEGVELAVIPGDVGIPYLPRGEPAIRGVYAVAAKMEEIELVEEVTRFEEGGQIGYAFGKKDLPKGDSRFNVFKTKELGYSIVYQTDLRNRRPKINARLKFKTPTTLQSGSVAVYSEKPGLDEKSQIERYEGGGAISSPVLKDKEVKIDLRTPDTLDMRVEQIGKTNIVKTDIGTEAAPIFALEREYKVTASNSGQDDVSIETYLGLSETERILESSLKQHDESSGRRIRWDVLVKAGEETIFSYKIQNAQFTPVSEDQIRTRLGSSR